jgi:small subunit ribosomal protein S3Ae
MVKRDTTQLKWKKKKWVDIEAPEIFKSVSLGHAMAEDQTKLVGRVIQANMMNVLKHPKMQSISMKFRITEVKELKGTTEPISYVMAPSAIKRLVRSRRDRIDDSFIVQTKDERKVRVKPILITHSNNSAAQRTQMRGILREQLATETAKRTYEEFVRDVVKNDLQKSIKSALAKVAPVRTIDMRAFQLV